MPTPQVPARVTEMRAMQMPTDNTNDKHNKNKQILIDTIQSEEGGRFLNEQNRNIFALANDNFDEELLPGYIWIDLYQLSFLNQFNNILNIQLRNLIALF